jgi:hypothetical protein
MVGYPSSSIVAICKFSFSWSILITSLSVTGFGTPGRACITFIIELTLAFDIKIRTLRAKFSEDGWLAGLDFLYSFLRYKFIVLILVLSLPAQKMSMKIL